MGSQINDIIISVNILISGNRLFFESKNSFSTMEGSDLSPSGIGLRNTQERLDMLYQGKYQLDLSEDNDLYVVKLGLDLV